MSETGGPDDVFPTPAWVVRRLFEAWRPRAAGGIWAEPAAGDGAIIRAADQALGGERSWLHALSGERSWLAVECRATCKSKLTEITSSPVEVQIADFLTAEPPERALDVDVCITNPPFTLAEAYVRRARAVYPNAALVFLLRQGFLASGEREPFFAEVGLPDVYVLPNRPGFTADGKTDFSEYMWAVWPAGCARKTGTWRRLALTSAEERGKKQRRSRG